MIGPLMNVSGLSYSNTQKERKKWKKDYLLPNQ